MSRGRTYQGLQSASTIIHQIIIILHNPGLEKQQNRRTAKLEIPQLLRPPHTLTLLARDDRRSNHHSTHTNHHNPAVTLGINWHDDPDILTIDIQRRADRHGVDSVVLTIQQLRFAHDAVDWDVKAMVVLWREAHDTESTIAEAFSIVWVGGTEKTLHAEFAALDPDALGVFHAVEDDGAAVGRGDDDVGVVWGAARAGAGFELAVEELVEGFEVFGGAEDFGHVELVEVDEAGNLGG